MGAKVQTTLSIPSSHFPPQKVGKTYSEEELQALFAEVDLNGNGTSVVCFSLLAHLNSSPAPPFKV